MPPPDVRPLVSTRTTYIADHAAIGQTEFTPHTPDVNLMRRLAPYLALALLIGAVAGCEPANERPDLAGAVDSAVAEAGDGGVIDLAEVIPMEWDTVYGFAGYVTNAQITEATGADFGSSDESLIPTDGLNLVVLINDGKVAAWFVLNHGDNIVAVRFAESLYGQPIARADAVFITVTTEVTTGGHDLYRLTLLR